MTGHVSISAFKEMEINLMKAILCYIGAWGHIQVFQGSEFTHKNSYKLKSNISQLYTVTYAKCLKVSTLI